MYLKKKHIYFCLLAGCETLQALAVRQMMEVQDQESLGRWDRLGSRDLSTRLEAMEIISQEVTRKVEAIGPLTSSPPATGTVLSSDLNDILAHLLMLSKRCPFEDVRERCIQLLQEVQVGCCSFLPNVCTMKLPSGILLFSPFNKHSKCCQISQKYCTFFWVAHNWRYRETPSDHLPENAA